jgi:tetratricopeptide (TPR) repeat protein
MRLYFLCFLILVPFLLKPQSAADTAEIWSRLRASERLKKNNVAGALDTLKPAVKLFSQAVHKDLQARVYFELGNNYILLGDNKIAEDYLNRGLALTASKPLRGDIYSSLGNLYSKKGDQETAIIMLLKSLKLYEESNTSNTRWAARQNLAICYAQSGKLKEAKKYFFEVLNTLGKLKGMEKSCADVSTNVGVLYEMLNMKDSAMVMYRKAYAILEQYGNSSSLAMVINNMGVICIRQKKYREGVSYMDKAKNMMLASGDNTGAVLTLNNLAAMLSGEGKADEAFSYSKLALRLSDSLGNLDGIIYSSQILSALSAKKKDYKSAYEYNRRAYSLSDSIKGSEKLKNIAEMESKYEAEKKQKEIELLSKDKELHESQIEKERNFRYFIIGFSCLVLVIALLLFYSLRNKQKTNAELNLRNQKIEQAYMVIEEKQKEILDSMHYAKRIQHSLLPSEKMIVRRMSEQKNQSSAG